MGDVVAMRKDGKPTVPLCKNCEYFRPTMGIRNPAHCSTPKRKGDFDPVYGWYERSIPAHDARHDNSDCGMAGNFYEEKFYLGPEEPTNPFDKPSMWKRFIERLFPRP